ncbi:succinate dehydrogenase, cytochrome b556 subunit [Halomonas heilongjiangensis]|uniref:Succinate dehydrogenase cytochrome b556 subunit n=1 Tax=Halomonas heilongjiangensis TaxID=1387883 RepID=A0A2N7TJD3_9GAMM|nr:succinate dehydrogenase [Halomonas heilongjiangensis]PMR68248.1 succinate dehydrogenase [Halomonas heilongjiangensis]PXX87491.1 succinate dehydrogenase [Halomonas heilongjiangensis]PXX89484.1 succinate dehydrogenase [Halomonas heilongjiangensis]PXX93215.1 succinate dehydrogenase [Halomonas heilongjiangensis]
MTNGSYALKARSHPSYVAFILHRVSGLLLAAFLPLHFLALSQALHGEAALDSFLSWADNPMVKIAEVGLVLMLALHLGCGLRVMALEALGWTSWQKSMVAIAFGGSLVAGTFFLLRVF